MASTAFVPDTPPAIVKTSHRANALCCQTLHRAVVESVHKLDVIIGSKASYREVFKPENISLRNKYVQLSQKCVCVCVCVCVRVCVWGGRSVIQTSHATCNLSVIGAAVLNII